MDNIKTLDSKINSYSIKENIGILEQYNPYLDECYFITLLTI